MDRNCIYKTLLMLLNILKLKDYVDPFYSYCFNCSYYFCDIQCLLLQKFFFIHSQFWDVGGII